MFRLGSISLLRDQCATGEDDPSRYDVFVSLSDTHSIRSLTSRRLHSLLLKPPSLLLRNILIHSVSLTKYSHSVENNVGLTILNKIASIVFPSFLKIININSNSISQDLLSWLKDILNSSLHLFFNHFYI